MLFDSCDRERHLKGGESLTRGDEAGNEVYIVLGGIVGLYHDLPSGERDVLGYCYSGDLIAPARFGETWGFDAKSLTSARLLELGIPFGTFDTALRRFSPWGGAHAQFRSDVAVEPPSLKESEAADGPPRAMRS